MGENSGYFRPATTVTLGMGIIYGKLLFCHGVSEVKMNNTFSIREYNNSTVYDCLNRPFTADFCSPYLNLYPINIDDKPRPHKISRYNLDMLPSNIYVASENYICTLTSLSDSP